MDITILAEDTCKNKCAKAEHGLCVFIKTKNHNLIFDTGASDITWQNAFNLGVDICKADTVIISHGHYDHTGGLKSFSEKNPQADIYINKNAFADFYHGEKYIGADKSILSLPNLHLTQGVFKIDDELEIFSDIIQNSPTFNSKALLKKENGKFFQDDFSHEQCLTISYQNQKILFCGCSHNGIINILEKFKNLYGSFPEKVIGGFHLAKQDKYSNDEINIIKNTAEYLLNTGAFFYTGHCTGKSAFDIMRKIMGNKINLIHCADKIYNI